MMAILNKRVYSSLLQVRSAMMICPPPTITVHQFAFADGHAELHRWRFAVTRRRLNRGCRSPMDIPDDQYADFDGMMDG